MSLFVLVIIIAGQLTGAFHVYNVEVRSPFICHIDRLRSVFALFSVTVKAADEITSNKWLK